MFFGESLSLFWIALSYCVCGADVEEFLQESQYEPGRFLVLDATSTYAWPYLVGLDMKLWGKLYWH